MVDTMDTMLPETLNIWTYSDVHVGGYRRFFFQIQRKWATLPDIPCLGDIITGNGSTGTIGGSAHKLVMGATF